MKCPLIKNILEIDTGETKQDLVDCLKEECAWWIAGDERCAVLVAAAHLIGLVAVGDELLKKMPHEGQFRR